MNKMVLYVSVSPPPQLYFASLMPETARYSYPHVQTGENYIGMPIVLVPSDWAEMTGWSKEEIIGPLQNKPFIAALTHSILQWFESEREWAQKVMDSLSDVMERSDE